MAIQSILRGRLLHTALGIGAVMFLTGAQGDGCVGGQDPEPQPPPWEVCPPGSHLELVCDPGCGDGHRPDQGGEAVDFLYSEEDPTVRPEGCVEMCVPDSICPEGTYEETICEGWGYDETLCLDPEGCPQPPPQEECYTTCVPFNHCGPGEIEEWVCELVEPGLCLDPQGCPPPREDCYPICIPGEDWCGPYGEPIEICDQWGCWQECYPYEGEPPPEPLPEPAE